MTIKVGCGSCQSTFAVRDDFAGKSVKCPKCKSPMKVPGADSPSKQPAAANKQTSPAKPTGSPGKPASVTSAASAAPRKFNPLLDLLDEAGVESKPRGRVCPMCSAEMAPTAVICIQCGFNSVTGERLETAILIDDQDEGTDKSDAEKLIAKAEKEIDEMPVSSVGQDFGEGNESYLIATVAIICLVLFVGLGVGVMLFMDTIIAYFKISPEAISLGASIVMGLGCIAYITAVAFMASPGHGIACLATFGGYCIVFGFMQGKTLLPVAVMLVISILIGLVSALFLTYGVGKGALDETMLRTIAPQFFIG